MGDRLLSMLPMLGQRLLDSLRALTQEGTSLQGISAPGGPSSGGSPSAATGSHGMTAAKRVREGGAEGGAEGRARGSEGGAKGAAKTKGHAKVGSEKAKAGSEKDLRVSAEQFVRGVMSLGPLTVNGKADGALLGVQGAKLNEALWSIWQAIDGEGSDSYPIHGLLSRMRTLIKERDAKAFAGGGGARGLAAMAEQQPLMTFAPAVSKPQHVYSHS